MKPLNRTIGERLLKARKRLGKSRSAMARMLEVTRITYYKWENDLVVPSVNGIKKISEALNVSAHWLIFGHGYKKQR